jgi:hypothetical protein
MEKNTIQKNKKVSVNLSEDLVNRVKKISGKKDITKVLENLLKEELEIQDRIAQFNK